MNAVLTIAGSDSSAGAGIQADIKSIEANRCYACSAITVITAQNTQGVSSIEPLSLKIIEEQINAIFKDIRIDAVKTGMLYSAEIIDLVAFLLKKYNAKNIVVDPVMVATSGDTLIRDTAIETYKSVLFPLAALITPNVDEAAVLMNLDKIERNQMIESSTKMGIEFKVPVLLKGGHLLGRESKDYLFINLQNEVHQFSAPTIATKNTHGTGCTLASAIAANLAKGERLENAVKLAKGYITNAILKAKDQNIGQGNGPVKHFF